MKKYMPTYVCISLAFICVAVFNIIGSKVLEDGTLSETFFLVPMMWLFIFIACITWGVTFILSRRQRKQI